MNSIISTSGYNFCNVNITIQARHTFQLQFQNYVYVIEIINVNTFQIQLLEIPEIVEIISLIVSILPSRRPKKRGLLFKHVTFFVFQYFTAYTTWPMPYTHKSYELQ